MAKADGSLKLCHDVWYEFYQKRDEDSTGPACVRWKFHLKSVGEGPWAVIRTWYYVIICRLELWTWSRIAACTSHIVLSVSIYSEESISSSFGLDRFEFDQNAAVLKILLDQLRFSGYSLSNVNGSGLSVYLIIETSLQFSVEAKV